MTRPGQHLILYDGLCGLCNRLNRFVLPRDPDGVFHFASLQSPLGQRLLIQFGRNPADLDSFHVITDYDREGRMMSKSQAALFMLKSLGWPWRALAAIGILPTSWLDLGYDLIASNRNRLFERYDTCPVPKAEHRSRFQDL